MEKFKDKDHLPIHRRSQASRLRRNPLTKYIVRGVILVAFYLFFRSGSQLTTVPDDSESGGKDELDIVDVEWNERSNWRRLTSLPTNVASSHYKAADFNP